jgi:hypothetical protein
MSSGETALNLYTRGREHHQNYLRKQQESFMLKHQNDQHGQREPDFEAKVIGCFKDCLTRQISDAVRGGCGFRASQPGDSSELI